MGLCHRYPRESKYPIIGYLGFGDSNNSAGFGQVYDHEVLGPLLYGS